MSSNKSLAVINSSITSSITSRLTAQVWLIWLIFGVMLTSLTGCRWLTTVQNIQKHPHRNWFTRTVYLEGTVGERAPLLGGQLYQLRDSTGTIWVLSPTKQVKTGDRISIKGQVHYQKIEIGGQNLGEVYIQEQQRLKPESSP